MLTLLASFVAAMSTAAPAIVAYLDKKSQRVSDIEMRKLDIELQDKRSQNALELADIEADVREGESLRTHDAALNGGKFVNALRASIRPVITYFFFFLFIAVKGFVLWHALSADGLIENQIAFADIYPLLWDEDTKTLFAAVIGFWFGGRVIDRMQTRH